ncbi:GA 2-oxidase 5 [Hordeum vulgare]|uniref:Fe2OG dioxygenase domain-containing protein n=1 Tax=Hordeum vulgare subsp. vulgare TaxID=112509 RepID=A0A8I6XWS0_HORVV|nr:gibberellin 2-beta-dioxygenase 3-like [Hordeum vulgare subsp. vulgare]KAE8778933.1 GA 2-oxidase 5 [Hordeum vulgare]
MVVLAKGELEQIALPAAQPPLAHVRAIDLSAAPGPGRDAAARALVSACEEQGFFKVTGHGVPLELVRAVEAAAAEFFALPQAEKEAAAGRPLGYGSKRIGVSGDLGWIEYLLLGVTPAGALPAASFASWTLPCAGAAVASSSEHPCPLRDLLEEYAAAVRRMACGVLELMAEGLGIGPADALSRLVSDGESDNMLRVNHYPPRPEMQGRLLTGFGEHTDPQIISVLRSNGTSGLEICARDGEWTSVPPDPDAFFVNVADALQVLTNGRFSSVKHRVVVSSERPRVSMIFFGGPPMGERLAPLRQLLGDGGRSKYREFTWKEYKSSTHKGRLATDRLCSFEN